MKEDDRAEREARVDEGGGAMRQERQRALGRFTARERIDALADTGTFVEIERYVVHRHTTASARLATQKPLGDGLICGIAKVDGRSVAVYAHDPTVFRGALGLAGSRKLCRMLDLAGERRLPVIALVDSEGARVDEGSDAVKAYGEVIARTIRLKGKVPQLTLLCGLAVGGAAYNAVLTDLVGMVDGQSFVFVTGAKVTRVTTGEDVSLEALGGAALHAGRTGSVSTVLASERDGIAWLRAVLSALVPEAPADDPVSREVPELEALILASPRQTWDVEPLLASVFDRGSVLPLFRRFAPNLATALARLGGRAVAVVASQPKALGGCLDVSASRKGARFVTFAGQQRLPILTLVDVPGYLPGKAQEELGILPHGASLLTAYGNANVPKVSVILRKSYGGASVLSFASDLRLALPTGRVALVGGDGAAELVFGPETDDMSDAQRAERAALRAKWEAEHDTVWAAAEEGYLDKVIPAKDLRRELALALSGLVG